MAVFPQGSSEGSPDRFGTPTSPAEGVDPALPDAAGGSARSRLVTLLGDLVLPTGGTAWLSTLSAAMSAFGVAPATTRQALRRLVAQDLVTTERRGRLAVYRLTPAARQRFTEAADRIYLRRPLAWDGRWRLLTYSFAEQDRPVRDALRRELRWLGYGPVGNGTWVCPWDLGSRLDVVLAKHDVARTVERFTAELGGDDRELAARAYDLDTLRAEHRRFIESQATRSAGSGGQESDTDADRAAFIRRVDLVHRWRRFLFLDPGLPPELVPTDWLGERAGAAFVDAYRADETAAWRYFLGLIAAADPGGQLPAMPGSNLDRPPSAAAVSTPPEGTGAAPARDASTAGSPKARTATTGRRLRGSGGRPVAVGAGDDDPQREADFLDRIHAGHKVEPRDWMPATYRRLNVRFIEMHANSEIMGALPEREWIARAPTLRRKRSLAAKVQDEVGHAHLIYRVAESLGRPRRAMYEDLIAGRGKFHNVFHYPTYTWGDVACIGFLVDGAAIVTQRALLETSYAPYVRVMRRVVAEESLHYRHGEDIMLALASGTDQQFAMLQEAVSRWWEPVMHFFGTDVARDDDPMIHWGIKTRTNEESRQEWINQYVPKLWDMGIETPDPGLHYDPDSDRWSYTEPDWERLKAIVTGPPTAATATRLYWRQLMHRNHAWIHDIVVGDDVQSVTAA
jgi:ring-1,2-phenylacetyl-CoA epoxidase subunit PaaA